MSREDRLPEGQKLFRQAYKDAPAGRLFVPVDADTLEALGRVARARGVPVGALAAQMITDALRDSSAPAADES